MKLLENYFNKYKNLTIQTKAALWYSFCNITQKGIQFLVVPLYIRLLTPSEYGKYAVFTSWSSILIIFATLNLYCGVFTKAMVDYDNDRDRYISCMQGLSTLITFSLFFLYLLFNTTFNTLLESDTITVCLLFLNYITYPAFSFWAVRQRVEYKYIMMVIVSLLSILLTPILSIILIKTTDWKELALIRGTLFAQIIIGGYFYIKHFMKCKCLYAKDYWQHALKFNIPLIPHYLSLIVLGQSDRIMIQKLCNNKAAGIYTLAYQISMAMTVLTNAINQSLVPWLYNKLKNKQYNEINSPYIKLCIIIAIGTVFTILIAPEIISIIGTNDYLEAKWIIPSVALSVFLTFCYSFFSSIEFYYNATQYVMIVSIIGSILNVTLNYIFIPIYGYIAAGYTTLICYFIQMILHHYFENCVCKKNNITIPLFNTKFLYFLTAILVSFSILSLKLYFYNNLRLIIILLFAVLLVIKRKDIKQIIQNLNTKESNNL